MTHNTEAVVKGYDMDGNYIEETVALDGTNPVVAKTRFVQALPFRFLTTSAPHDPQ